MKFLSGKIQNLFGGHQQDLFKEKQNRKSLKYHPASFCGNNLKFAGKSCSCGLGCLLMLILKQ